MCLVEPQGEGPLPHRLQSLWQALITRTAGSPGRAHAVLGAGQTQASIFSGAHLAPPSRPGPCPDPPAPQTEGEELKPSGGGQAGARRRARRCFQGRLDRAPGQQTSSSGERLPREAAARAGPGRVAPLWGSAGLAQRRQEGGQREGPRDRDGGRGRPPEGGGGGGRAGPEGTSNTPPASLTARSWGSFPSLGSCRGSWSGLLHCRGMVTRRRKHLG